MALPQKSPGQIFSVQPLCSLCLGGGFAKKWEQQVFILNSNGVP